MQKAIKNLVAFLIAISAYTSALGMEVEQKIDEYIHVEIWTNIVLQSGEKIPAVLSAFYETSKHLKHVTWLIRRQKFYEETQTWLANYGTTIGLGLLSARLELNSSHTNKINSFDRTLRLASLYNVPVHVQIYCLH